MLAKRVALILVALAVVGILAFKATRGSDRGAASNAGETGLPTPAPAVVLVADMREANSECGCGQLIRRVRAAAAHGVTVQEVSPDNVAIARLYGVTVAPTVVFLGPDGQVIARRQGESQDTLDAVSAELTKLEGAHR